MISAIITSVSTIAVAFISSIIFEVYKPDVKKHASLIKKLLRFILLYGSVIIGIVYLLNDTKVINKWFILLISISVGMLFSLATIDIIKHIYFKHSDNKGEISNEDVQKLRDAIAKAKEDIKSIGKNINKDE